MSHGFHGKRINAISFALVKKGNSLRHFYKTGRQMANSISCGSLVPNIAQIGQYMWEVGHELTYSVNKYGFRCANLQETHNQSLHFVEICTEFCPYRDKECNKYKQNFIYSIEYSQFATAPVVTKLAVP